MIRAGVIAFVEEDTSRLQRCLNTRENSYGNYLEVTVPPDWAWTPTTDQQRWISKIGVFRANVTALQQEDTARLHWLNTPDSPWAWPRGNNLRGLVLSWSSSSFSCLYSLRHSHGTNTCGKRLWVSLPPIKMGVRGFAGTGAAAPCTLPWTRRRIRSWEWRKTNVFFCPVPAERTKAGTMAWPPSSTEQLRLAWYVSLMRGSWLCLQCDRRQVFWMIGFMACIWS